MTPDQTRMYFRKWNPARVALAAGATTDMGRKVTEMATHMAARDARKVDAEALRHACHVVALGREKSSKHLTNAELDRVLLVFKLVINGDDLAAVIAWEQPDQGQVKRLTWSIRNTAPEALIVHVCKDKNGRGDWLNLGTTELRQLLMTLKRIREKQKVSQEAAEVAEAGAEVGCVEEPF
jgi:hypothetical protein